MSQITEQHILDSLRHIIDPDLHKDIVSLGFVKNIRIEGQTVSFDIELTTPACPVKAEFKRAAETAVSALEGVSEVRVNMTSAKKRSPMETVQQNSTLATVKTIIAISSCKGGVGKSTVAANLALEIAQRGYQVGLLDADIYGPSLPTLFGIAPGEPMYQNQKGQLVPLQRLGLKLMSFGFLLEDGPAVLRGPMVSQYIMQILHNTDWGELDYLFIDLPPGTGDIQLSITQSVKLDGAVIVTTHQALSLADVTRGILMFEKVKVPMLGVVENMAYATCDHCNEKNYIFGDSKAGSLKERFGLDVLAEIPIQKEYNVTMTTYRPTPAFTQAADQVIRAVGKISLLESPLPEITHDQQKVVLTWSNGDTIQIEHKTLRASCTCALCVDELTGEKTLKESDIRADIQPLDILPLGHYAFSVRWSDGHSSSIYAYDMIKERFSGQTAKR